MDLIIKPQYSPEYKQNAWNEIKKHPDCANFITEASRLFGKPAHIHFTTEKKDD